MLSIGGDWILTWGLLIGPLITSAKHFSPYEVPKAIFVWIWALGVAGMTILRQRQNQALSRPGIRIIAALLMLFIWVVISSTMNNSLATSVYGNPYRADGLVTILALTMLSLSVAARSAKWWEIGTRWCGWGGLSVAVIAILQLSLGKEIVGTFGNTNILAGYLVVTLPMVGKLGKWAMMISIIAILATGSWGGWLGLAIYGLVSTKLETKYKIWIGIAAVGAAVLGSYLALEQRLQQDEIVAERRERILTKAGIAVWQKPLWGWGWANFEQAFQEVDWPFHFEHEAYVDRAHAQLAEVGVAGGVPALILYGYVVMASLVQLGQAKDPTDRVWITSLMLYLVVSQTNVTSVMTELMLYLAVGKAIGQIS